MAMYSEGWTLSPVKLPGTPLHEKRVLAIMPMNAEAMNLGYKPGPNHTVTQCELCGDDGMIGPRQRAVKSQVGRNAVVICLRCAVSHFGTDFDVMHLGGP